MCPPRISVTVYQSQIHLQMPSAFTVPWIPNFLRNPHSRKVHLNFIVLRSICVPRTGLFSSQRVATFHKCQSDLLFDIFMFQIFYNYLFRSTSLVAFTALTGPQTYTILGG